ncbi:hypothetical protein KC316_g18434 [Hortaea werneckii]|nr:hypothetical protein KC316_g18434 [Hortaea werneckii]
MDTGAQAAQLMMPLHHLEVRTINPRTRVSVASIRFHLRVAGRNGFEAILRATWLTWVCVTVGFYRGFSSAHANRQMELENMKPAGSEQTTMSESPRPVPPGVRAEGGYVTLPATVYQRGSNPSADAVPMLDGTPIHRPLSQSSRGSSRFREHIAEMEDTSFRPVPGQAPPARSPKSPDTDSPTLGRDSGLSGPSSLSEQVRRKQHLMSWNSYETKLDAADQSMRATMTPKTPPSAQGIGQAGQVSPDTSGTPVDRDFVVSPLNSLDLGRRVHR